MATPCQQPLLPKRETPTCNSFLYALSASIIIIATALISSHHFIDIKNVYRDTETTLIAGLCEKSYDPNSCLGLISKTFPNGVKNADPIDLFRKFSLHHASYIIDAIQITKKLLHSGDGSTPAEKEVLGDCLKLLELSHDRVTDSVEGLTGRRSTSRSQAADVNSWISSVLTNYDTCLDEIELHQQLKSLMKPLLQDLVSRARTSLAILVQFSGSGHPKHSGPFPSWARGNDTKLLKSSGEVIKADVVVSKDGTGDYSTVKGAIASVPDERTDRYVVYVKEGVYEENVEVGKKKKNLMIVGDGMDRTIITGSLNAADGTTTFRSATLAAVGDGFILQDIWIQNKAGPQKYQAVALRVGADKSVINRCRIDGYQDTLYVHSLRQFYRDCRILGTVDFVFGNAAVVFQKCKFIARKPMARQKNMVTAQSRIDPNQNTGISIQYSDIIPSSDLAPVWKLFPTYLGRPWKEYSRVVVMQSFIGAHVDPAGWAKWNGDFAIKSLYYGEYLNRGPGADTHRRVKWPRYHVIRNPEEAKKFTVAELIQGGSWLKSSGVPYVEWL